MKLKIIFAVCLLVAEVVDGLAIGADAHPVRIGGRRERQGEEKGER